MLPTIEAPLMVGSPVLIDAIPLGFKYVFSQFTNVSAGNTTSNKLNGVMVMVCEQEDWLPHASVTIQVRDNRPRGPAH